MTTSTSTTAAVRTLRGTVEVALGPTVTSTGATHSTRLIGSGAVVAQGAPSQCVLDAAGAFTVWGANAMSRRRRQDLDGDGTLGFDADEDMDGDGVTVNWVNATSSNPKAAALAADVVCGSVTQRIASPATTATSTGISSGSYSCVDMPMNNDTTSSVTYTTSQARGGMKLARGVVVGRWLGTAA